MKTPKTEAQIALAALVEVDSYTRTVDGKRQRVSRYTRKGKPGHAQFNAAFREAASGRRQEDPAQPVRVDPGSGGREATDDSRIDPAVTNPAARRGIAQGLAYLDSVGVHAEKVVVPKDPMTADFDKQAFGEDTMAAYTLVGEPGTEADTYRYIHINPHIVNAPIEHRLYDFGGRRRVMTDQSKGDTQFWKDVTIHEGGHLWTQQLLMKSPVINDPDEGKFSDFTAGPLGELLRSFPFQVSRDGNPTAVNEASPEAEAVEDRWYEMGQRIGNYAQTGWEEAVAEAFLSAQKGEDNEWANAVRSKLPESDSDAPVRTDTPALPAAIAALKTTVDPPRRVTLYRGEGSHDHPSYYPATGPDALAGGWWTSDRESAARYAASTAGGKVYQVEVEEGEFEPRGGPNYFFITDPEVRARRTLAGSQRQAAMDWDKVPTMLTGEAKAALDAYQIGTEVNAWLRNGTMPPEGSVLNSQINHLQAAIKSRTFDQDKVLYRGMVNMWHKIPDEVGATFEDLGFVSTSKSEKAANQFGIGSGLDAAHTAHLVRIHVRRGQHGLDVWQAQGGDPMQEEEVILPPGSKFKITKVAGPVVDVDYIDPYETISVADRAETTSDRAIDRLLATT